MRLVIITCYFGKLPWYLCYFLHSCGYNPTIDFCVITDDVSYEGRLPLNVRFVYKSLEELRMLASDKLGLPVKIENGYKCCDWKPAYAFLFPEIVNGYDFWGHGDLDVIYGNIRSFITDEVLCNHDLVSVRPDWVTGCFLLFRNCDKMNRLFMHSRDYERVFTDSRHYCFDETNFQHDAFTAGKRYTEVPSEIESMMHVVQRLAEAGYIRPYFDLHIIEGRPGRLAWNRGTLVYKKEYEALLYHLIRLKEIYRPEKIPRRMPEAFIISPTRIYL
jgi:hypothetical protein